MLTFGMIIFIIHVVIFCFLHIFVFYNFTIARFFKNLLAQPVLVYQLESKSILLYLNSEIKFCIRI